MILHDLHQPAYIHATADYADVILKTMERKTEKRPMIGRDQVVCLECKTGKPLCEKTNNLSFRISLTQTGLYSL